MADLDLTQEIRSLRATFADIQHVVDVKRLNDEIVLLKQQAADPNIWDELDEIGCNNYDYIIFADVLEHLHNPTDVLSKSKIKSALYTKYLLFVIDPLIAASNIW